MTSIRQGRLVSDGRPVKLRSSTCSGYPAPYPTKVGSLRQQVPFSESKIDESRRIFINSSFTAAPEAVFFSLRDDFRLPGESGAAGQNITISGNYNLHSSEIGGFSTGRPSFPQRHGYAVRRSGAGTPADEDALSGRPDSIFFFLRFDFPVLCVRLILVFVCNILIIMRLCGFMILVSTVFYARFAMTGN